jgi:hypothetical protein
MGPNGGRLFANLAAIGLTPRDIDVVVVSHTHPDHVGNLRTPEGDKAFPRAWSSRPKPTGTSSSGPIPTCRTCRCPEDFRRRFGAAIKRSVEPIASDVTALPEPALRSFPASRRSPHCRCFFLYPGLFCFFGFFFCCFLFFFFFLICFVFFLLSCFFFFFFPRFFLFLWLFPPPVFFYYVLGLLLFFVLFRYCFPVWLFFVLVF